MQSVNQPTTLLIKKLPSDLTEAEVRDLLEYFGARSVSVMSAKGHMRGCAFAEFCTAEEAHIALRKLHQAPLFSSRLVVEYSDKTYLPVEPPDPQQIIETAIVDEAPKLDATPHQPDPSLHYLYPPPTPHALNNISHALITVPHFYVQVLHLMNKMNLPPPFLQSSEKSIFEQTETAPPPLPSSSESELESEEEEVVDQTGKEKEIYEEKRLATQAFLDKHLDSGERKRKRQTSHDVSVKRVTTDPGDQAAQPSSSKTVVELLDVSSTPSVDTGHVTCSQPITAQDAGHVTIATHTEPLKRVATGKQPDTKHIATSKQPESTIPVTMVTIPDFASESPATQEVDMEIESDYCSNHGYSESDEEVPVNKQLTIDTASKDTPSKDTPSKEKLVSKSRVPPPPPPGPPPPPPGLPPSLLSLTNISSATHIPLTQPSEPPARPSTSKKSEPSAAKKSEPTAAKKSEPNKTAFEKHRKQVKLKVLLPDKLQEHAVFKKYSAGSPSPKLYIKNLNHKSVCTEDLVQLFKPYFDHYKSAETASEMEIKLMSEGRMKGQAFVLLPSVQSAEAALSDVHGYVLRDKPMAIMFAKSK